MDKSKAKREAVGWTRRKANIDTRKVILQEATQLFSEKGIDKTSMRDIARAVGIQAASLYNHFDSRTEILYTVLKDGMQALVDLCAGILESAPGSPTERLFQLVKEHVIGNVSQYESVPMRDTQLYKSFSTTNALTDDQIIKLTALQDAVLHMFRDTLADGKRAGEMDFEDATVSAFSILGMIEHTVYWYNKDGPIKHLQLAEMIAKQALRSVGAK